MRFLKTALTLLLSAALVINPACAEAEEAALVSLANSGVNGLISGQFDGGQAFENAAIAALTAALSSGVGDLKSALQINPGNLASGTLNPVATLESALLHGIVGCVGSSLSGQSCGSGFVSGSISDLANVVSTGNTASDLLLHAVIGGTASQLSGGDFATGALNATLAEMFNFLSHPQIVDFQTALNNCGSDSTCQQNVANQAIALSNAQNAALSQCQTQACIDSANAQIQAARAVASQVLGQNALTDPAIYDQLYKLQTTATGSAFNEANIRTQAIDDAIYNGVCSASDNACQQNIANQAVATYNYQQQMKAAIVGMILGGVSPAAPEIASGISPVTSEGTANAATIEGLKTQLSNQNLANIAAQDVRLAAAVNGDVAIGQGTAAEADALGKIWVGDGYKVSSDGSSLISADGTMVYRFPALKPNTPAQYNPTGIQANFVIRSINPITGVVTNKTNSHMVITP